MKINTSKKINQIEKIGISIIAIASILIIII